MLEITMTKMPYGYNFFNKEKNINIFCYGLNKRNALKEFRKEANLKHKKLKVNYAFY